MGLPIENIKDLQAEIARLEALKVYQEEQLKERFKSPVATFHTVSSVFRSGGTGKNDWLNGDLLSLVSRFALPMALNKTFFRKSGFIMKTLITLASQKASNYINENAVISVVDKIKDFLKPKKRGFAKQKSTTNSAVL